MAELNFKQITDKLNEEFRGEGRKIVFWYDDNKDFVDDIDSLDIKNAKVFKLEKDNQFYTKYLLEREDVESNYLIYAPFPKPGIRENHLEDTVLYSKRFYADRASLLMVDIGIDQKLKPVIQKYIKFFGAKDRTQRFYDLNMEEYTEESIETGLMSVLTRAKIAYFDEVTRVVLTEGSLDDNKYLVEFQKYGLVEPFWKMCELQYGYTDPSPNLQKLLITMFVTYTDRYIQDELPDSWKSFVSYKSGNIIAFLDNLMNNLLYKEKYDELSNYVSKSLGTKSVLEKYSSEALIHCDTFKEIDWVIIDWIKERLLEEDLGAAINGKSIPEICQARRKKHFAEKFRSEYHLLESAYHVITAVNYVEKTELDDIIRKYLDEDYKIDRRYRRFYYNYDMLSDDSRFEKLRERVENIYTNRYLEKSIYKWNKALEKKKTSSLLPPQREFFKQYVQNSKDRVVVIISDAMRYEVGMELFERLVNDEKCTPEIQTMMGSLPSFTRLGMAALLPNKDIEITEDYKVLVDGKACDSLIQRESILKTYLPQSRCIQFDDIKNLNKENLREVFTGMEVVYVYHNQIDARGDKANTENEVFNACYEAIDEIHSMIRKISTNANSHHFIITSDHGFIYKRFKIQEKDKITNLSEKTDLVNRRFIVSKNPIVDDGIISFQLGEMMGNKDSRYVSVPISSNIYKLPGGGQNFVHGGSSPQELIIPVIDVKVERYHTETKPARIALVSMFQKVTNLIVSLDFMQNEPVSDVVKETTYKIFFISEDNERISNENIYVADKKDSDTNKRIFRMKFNFKNMVYDKNKRYFLVAVDDKNDVEIIRHEVVMDIAFSNDYGFDV
ncbi:MAG: BREX-1 system phosphatase PglZ type A [Gudongella sp.]|nr:BREX-1 system phosphatase PglZ type A [Gudongella sp.]